MSLIHDRRDYNAEPLRKSDLDPDPIRQFERWYRQAEEAGLNEPYAMVLATADAQGIPSARIVLLRGYGPEGFRFFSNARSQKGRELRENPRASLVFDWHEIDRQVRVDGDVEAIPDPEADAYFESRPLEAKLGAWASDQSAVIPNRRELEARFEEVAQRFGDGPIPRPPGWVGYRVRPTAIEFWQGRPGRLHDRLRYRLAEGGWIIERLAP